MTSQCFCMNSTSGRDGCMAMRWTQWPTSASGSGMLVGPQALVHRLPGLAAVVGAERPGRRDGDVHALGVLGSRRIVCRHIPPAPGCQFGPEPWRAQAGQLLPALATVGATEQGRVLDAGVDRVGVGRATARGARRGRTPTGAACRRTTGGCRARRRTRTRCRPAPRSCRRRRSAGSSWPNQPLDCDAYSRSGSAGEPFTW